MVSHSKHFSLNVFIKRHLGCYFFPAPMVSMSNQKQILFITGVRRGGCGLITVSCSGDPSNQSDPREVKLSCVTADWWEPGGRAKAHIKLNEVCVWQRCRVWMSKQNWDAFTAITASLRGGDAQGLCSRDTVMDEWKTHDGMHEGTLG